MNKQHDPKTHAGHKPEDRSANKQHGDKSNSEQNFDKGHNQSGYAEKEPRKKPNQAGQQPKVTNEENDITNSDQENRIDETEEQGKYSGDKSLADNQDPEIDTPIHDPEKTEKKIPSIKK
ncbi:MAG: hypothetical protein J7578_18115 [Chitinophagaceae bacterium]|nr:hypothetical protein [Chitinophagaceae bacterium]